MIRIFILVFLACVPFSAQAQESYFSLTPGNEWTFYDTTPDTVMRGTWRIIDGPIVEENQYVLVEFAGRAADTLRADEEGRILAYHTDQEWLLFDFDLPEGSTYNFVTAGDPLSLVVTVHRDVSVEWREGTFHDAVRFVFENEETGAFNRSFAFAQGVGLVHYETEGGAEGRLYSATVDGRVITTTEDNLLAESPHLLSVYPNPVGSEATINFEGFNQSGASIRLYDLMGRLAAEIPLAPHTRQVIWQRPSELAPGVYIFQIHAGEEIVTRPVVLR